ncbi:polynucleotide adenylyltransferase [Besnoitia besnoiti]|uniref:Polynucleotide adenylyltransferase n=1 Tax=Besnoitia besnoiti TaxID=94643 RepID=A0A2A9M2V0_BESBE|nr:polynucleotide adenylyltransferase [Besnoitia besnoiti]PFH31544.1 polynucleotide adenylyltransferase [Besnoitia besnoiti]
MEGDAPPESPCSPVGAHLPPQSSEFPSPSCAASAPSPASCSPSLAPCSSSSAAASASCVAPSGVCSPAAVSGKSWLQGADAYLLVDEERHRKQRELNQVFKEKQKESQATPADADAGELSSSAAENPSQQGDERHERDGAREGNAAAAAVPATAAARGASQKEEFLAFEKEKRATQSATRNASNAQADREEVAASLAPWFRVPAACLSETTTTAGRNWRGDERDRGDRHRSRRDRGHARLPTPPSFHVSLHKEICDLLKYIQPTAVEEYKMLKAVARLRFAASLCFPGCSCRCFGSFATNLGLPGADVDVCLVLPAASPFQTPPQAAPHAAAQAGARVDAKRPRDDAKTAFLATLSAEAARRHSESVAQLTLLATTLQSLDVAQALELVATARVPIVKYIDAETGVPVDVTVNQISSLETTAFVRQMLLKFPLLRPLLLLVKLLLKMRNLSETYRGGAGSYLLFTMAVLFLKTWPAAHDPTLQRDLLLSHLLLDFLFFWSRHWNYKDWGGCVRGLGHTFLKNIRPDLWGDRRELLCMESPTTPDVDLGKNAFNIASVRAAFHQAFADLMAVEVEWNQAEARWIEEAEEAAARNLPISPFPRRFSESLLAHLYDTSHPIFALREPRRTLERAPGMSCLVRRGGVGRQGGEETEDEALAGLLGLGVEPAGVKSESADANAAAWMEPEIPPELLEEVAVEFLAASASWSGKKAKIGGKKRKNRPQDARGEARDSAAEEAEGAEEGQDERLEGDNAQANEAPPAAAEGGSEAEDKAENVLSTKDSDSASDNEMEDIFTSFGWSAAERQLAKKKSEASYASFLTRLASLAPA